MHLDSFKYFYPERPRLLHVDQPLFEQLSANPQWIAEPKYNGSRLMLHHLDGAWQFWNRHEQLMAYCPSEEVKQALAGMKIKGYWLFDGELRHHKTKGVHHRIALYDVCVAGGVLLCDQLFADRRFTLEALFHYLGPDNGYHLDLAPQYDTDFRAVFQRLTPDEEIEGLVIKNLRGRLNLGRTRAVESNWMWKVRKPSGRYQF